MKRNILKCVSAFLSIVFLFSACTSQVEETAEITAGTFVAEDGTVYQEHIPGRTGYRNSICTMDAYASNLNQEVIAVTYRDGLYNVIVSYRSFTDGHVDSVKLYKINSDGEVTETRDLVDISGFDYIFLDDVIISWDFSGVRQISYEDGSVLSESRSVLNNISRIVPYKDGYVAFNYGTVVYCDLDGNELGRIENDMLCMGATSNVFEQNDTTYAYVEVDMVNSFYYELNFNTGTVNEVANVYEDLGIDIHKCTGRYVFDEIGGYEVNFNSDEKEYFVEWFNTDVKPSLYDYNTFYKVIDQDRFVITSSVDLCSTTIQIFEYDPTIDYSDRIVLTVGSMYVDNYALKCAIYEYNRSQDEYRVKTEQYFQSDIDSAEDIVNYNAQLVSRFSSGEAPDIFFGNDFDYEYFGRNGMVIDILPYLEASESFNSDELFESAWNLMCHDGVCYQIFYAFALTGYFSRDDMGIPTDMTYEEMYSLRDDVTSIIGPDYSREIAGNIINYSFVDFIDENGDFTLTYNQVEDIVRIALDGGLPSTAPYEFVEDSWIATGDILMANTYINDVAGFATFCNDIGGLAQFVGHPSVYDSAHLVYPEGNAAVSADTEYPQACVDFLTYFFNEDVQRGANIPVNRNIYDEYCTYAMDNSQHGTNSVYDIRLEYQSEVTPEIVEAFTTAIDSIDTLQIYDFSIYSMISEEIETYYTLGKTPEQIADSLYERLNLYVNENY